MDASSSSSGSKAAKRVERAMLVARSSTAASSCSLIISSAVSSTERKRSRRCSEGLGTARSAVSGIARTSVAIDAMSERAGSALASTTSRSPSSRSELPSPSATGGAAGGTALTMLAVLLEMDAPSLAVRVPKVSTPPP